MASDNFKQAVLDYGDAFIEEIIKQLYLNNKNVTGELINSLDYRIIETANEVTLEILANDYFNAVDRGRKPGTLPNVSAIQKWVAAKGIKFTSGKRALTTNQMGWAIAKSIQMKGIRPSNIMKKAKATFFANKQNLQPIIDEGVLDVKQLIRTAIKNLKDN